MEELALKLENVSISYRTINPFRLRRAKDEFDYQKIEEVVAVNDVSFSVPEGHIVGIVGKNGSGKSTLLKAIAGIFSPDTGRIELYNNQVSLLALGVGFQTSLTGWENIYLSGMLLGFSKEYIKSKEKEIIEFSELGDFIYKPINAYSSGMAMRLAFSISAILDSDIILVDEVLGVGDVSFRKKSYNKLQEKITDRHTTVLLVSHSENTILELCDQVVWLDHGGIMQKGDPEKVVSAYLDFMKK
jgi:ABC-type polysaccharide/polyol phosphate transport system ATPase subunit